MRWPSGMLAAIFPTVVFAFLPAPGVCVLNRQILWEKSFSPKLSGNQVHCSHAWLLLIKIMLCGKLQCQKVLNRNSFSIKLLSSNFNTRRPLSTPTGDKDDLWSCRANMVRIRQSRSN
jgi:hypothetical protein